VPSVGEILWRLLTSFVPLAVLIMRMRWHRP
jgi:hypothetical protein